jgi:hypothetical protein
VLCVMALDPFSGERKIAIFLSTGFCGLESSSVGFGLGLHAPETRLALSRGMEVGRI